MLQLAIVNEYIHLPSCPARATISTTILACFGIMRAEIEGLPDTSQTSQQTMVLNAFRGVFNLALSIPRDVSETFLFCRTAEVIFCSFASQHNIRGTKRLRHVIRGTKRLRHVIRYKKRQARHVIISNTCFR